MPGDFAGLEIRDLLTGLALVAVFEGVLYALFPGVIRRGVETVSRSPDSALRIGGVVAAALGVAGVWLARS